MEILQDVWGYNFDPRTNIVEVYVAYLRKKLDRPGEPSLVRTSRGFGYSLAVDDAPEPKESAAELRARAPPNG